MQTSGTNTILPPFRDALQELAHYASAYAAQSTCNGTHPTSAALPNGTAILQRDLHSIPSPEHKVCSPAALLTRLRQALQTAEEHVQKPLSAQLRSGVGQPCLDNPACLRRVVATGPQTNNSVTRGDDQKEQQKCQKRVVGQVDAHVLATEALLSRLLQQQSSSFTKEQLVEYMYCLSQARIRSAERFRRIAREITSRYRYHQSRQNHRLSNVEISHSDNGKDSKHRLTLSKPKNPEETTNSYNNKYSAKGHDNILNEQCHDKNIQILRKPDVEQLQQQDKKELYSVHELQRLLVAYTSCLEQEADSQGGINITVEDSAFLAFLAERFVEQERCLYELTAGQLTAVLRCLNRLSYKHSTLLRFLGKTILHKQKGFTNHKHWALCIHTFSRFGVPLRDNCIPLRRARNFRDWQKPPPPKKPKPFSQC